MRRNAGLRLGDRVVSIDGRSVEGLKDQALALRSKHPGQQIAISGWRDGRAEKHLVTLAPASLDSGLFTQLFVAVARLLMPWLCVGLGFWVAAVRPRDPNAWLVLGILIGISEFTRNTGLDPRGWPALGLAVEFYDDLAVPLWSASMLLFGFYFPQRWRLTNTRPGSNGC